MRRVNSEMLCIAAAAALSLSATCVAQTHDDDRAAVQREVAKRHDESSKRRQAWIALPSIAAESRNSQEGAEYMAKLARDAGFQQTTVIQTDGKPGVFATLDAGAAKT